MIYKSDTLLINYDSTVLKLYLRTGMQYTLCWLIIIISGPLAGKLQLESDLPNLLDLLRSAVPCWRNVGVCLGFRSSELDVIERMPLLVLEGCPGYFREMLSQWLKWAPPNHLPPTILNLASALRRTGEEAAAFNLEITFGINGLLQRVCSL